MQKMLGFVLLVANREVPLHLFDGSLDKNFNNPYRKLLQCSKFMADKLASLTAAHQRRSLAQLQLTKFD
jgi:hypothetical protein